MIRFLTTLILLKSVFAFACDMDRATSETQFVIDPSLKLMKIESKKDLSVFEVSKCSLDEKFILINFNTIYYQDDTSRRESISGQLLTQTSNCSIKTEQPIQKIENGFLDQLVKEKYNFIKQCSRLVITDLRGQKITTSPNSNCQLKPLDASGSSVETDGSNCFIAMTPNTRLEVKTKLNPECLDTNFLKVHQIEAQDFETVIRLWPIQADQGQMKVQSPFGARYLRYTVLPEAQFMPRAVLDEQSQFSFVSVLITNIHPGQIAISQMGKSMINIQPNFIVENFSKKYCKNKIVLDPLVL